MNNQTHWLQRLAKTPSGRAVLGLVSTAAEVGAMQAVQRSIVERARDDYGADYVFFSESGALDQVSAQALIYVDDHLSDEAFGKLHRRLWSWGVVPLVYRKRLATVDLLRCAHRPEFLDSEGRVIYQPFETFDLLTTIDEAAKRAQWWQESDVLRSGALWDDPRVCAQLLSKDQAAHERLFLAVRDLHNELAARNNLLPKHLRQRLLVLSLIIAYLEDRKILTPRFFSQHKKGARAFFEVLGDAPALVSVLSSLEVKFNGDVFTLNEADREKILSSTQLTAFSTFVEARIDAGNQITLWKLYSFRDLPIELISHIYQLFLDNEEGSVYTPPFLAKLLAAETLSEDRLNDLLLDQDKPEDRGEGAILDPSCGSGVFLVEAYKRLILHWRMTHEWQRPSVATLQELCKKIRGVDLSEEAIELAAFSLCLAMCEALDDETIRKSRRLFPKLRETSLFRSCFFEHAASPDFVRPKVILGNPPFTSRIDTDGEVESAARFKRAYGADVPDKHVAYLFLNDGLEFLAPGGVLCLLQQYSFLYNQKSASFRSAIFEKWNVREIFDFTSIRGVFRPKDTKVIALIAESAPPPPDSEILHAVFRRSGRAAARQGLDIDYYDLHWVSPAERHFSHVWMCNVFGGGRTTQLIARLAQMPTLGQYADSRNWKKGVGFAPGDPNKGRGKDAHVRGRDYLSPWALTKTGIDWEAISQAPSRAIEEPRTAEQFTPPMLLVRRNIELQNAYVSASQIPYLTYPDQIYGFCATEGEAKRLQQVKEWIDDQSDTLRAYIAVTSSKAFKQRATALSAADILRLPYPGGRSMAISPNEQIVIKDLVDHVRDFVLNGDQSALYLEDAHNALADFCQVYTRQINTVYDDLRALASASWPGAVCQPFVFGANVDIDWSGVEDLRDRVSKLLVEDTQATGLSLRRVARIYDGRFIFLIKPDRLRFWIRSIALRDADETLADLRSQQQQRTR